MSRRRHFTVYLVAHQQVRITAQSAEAAEVVALRIADPSLPWQAADIQGGPGWGTYTVFLSASDRLTLSAQSVEAAEAVALAVAEMRWPDRGWLVSDTTEEDETS